MNYLKVFSHKDLGGIRALEIDGQPWFVGKDIAEILGYEAERNALNQHVDKEDKLTHQISASGQGRNMTIINESGLYSLILSSKLPKAKEFKRWVTSEVLPSIRKTGGYVAGNEMEFIVNKVMENVTAQLPAIIAETVKLTLNLISNDVQPIPLPALKKPKKRRISYHGKLDKLPIELRNEVIAMIFQKNYTYIQVQSALEEKGVEISYSSIGRYIRRLADEIDGLQGIDIER